MNYIDDFSGEDYREKDRAKGKRAKAEVMESLKLIDEQYWGSFDSKCSMCFIALFVIKIKIERIKIFTRVLGFHAGNYKL